MNSIISASGLSKRYDNFVAVDNIDLEIGSGKIVGLIGPNGAGKTSLLRCMLGLSTYEGKLRVLGKNPSLERVAVSTDVAYIADTAILPSWIKVHQLLEYMEVMHPKFSRVKAQSFLDETEISPDRLVKQLSKGMITQLHLALAISIDASLLVLDEPTLGLDILYRKKFYEQLSNDYFDESKTILITTHQVEEVENLLTDLIFIKNGKLILNAPMEQVAATFTEIEVRAENLEQARSLSPISERAALGATVMLFENVDRAQLGSLGTFRSPSVTDLFVAKMSR